MPPFFSRLFRMIRPVSLVPPELRQTFFHLYMDIAWFGVLSGSTVAFLAVYATRQGATPQQIGWLTAVPGLVNLVFALPAGGWLSRRPLGRAVFWASLLQRMFYIAFIPLPVLLAPNAQVAVIIYVSLLMTIPGTAVVVGFNSLFGEVVPMEWRGYVVGLRNALLSIITVVFTLISGAILDRVTFPTGYQIVFAIGVVGAGMSSLHLYYLARMFGAHQTGKYPVVEQPAQNGARLAGEIRALYYRSLQNLRLDAMKGPFARIMALLFGWHLFQYMAIPLFTPFVVNELHLDDQTIGLAAALFSTATFFGSLVLNRMTSRSGNKKITGAGIMILSLYPILTSMGPAAYMLASVIGGFAWAMAGGALYNYILENIPSDDRPAHLAWYNLVMNAAILVGSLTGPLIAGQIGFVAALVLFGIGRFLAGAAIHRWG